MVKMISPSPREGGCGERGKQVCGQRRRAREEMRREEGEERGLGVGREEARAVVGWGKGRVAGMGVGGGGWRWHTFPGAHHPYLGLCPPAPTADLTTIGHRVRQHPRLSFCRR